MVPFVGRGAYRSGVPTRHKINAATWREACCTGCLFGSSPLSLADSLSDAWNSQIRRQSPLLPAGNPAAAGVSFTATVTSGVGGGTGAATGFSRVSFVSGSSRSPPSCAPAGLPSSNGSPADWNTFAVPVVWSPARPPVTPPALLQLPLPAPPFLAILLPMLLAEAGRLPTDAAVADDDDDGGGGDDDVVRLVLPLLVLPLPRGLVVTASMVVVVVVVVVVTTAGGASGPLGGRLLPALGCLFAITWQ